MTTPKVEHRPSPSARLGAGRYLEAGREPVGTVTTVRELRTHDGSTVGGILRTVPGATVVVTIMHPRQDTSHHPIVPELLARGIAVWTQGTRSVNNDLSLIHEQALLDAAAGQRFVRDAGFGTVISFGHSGGGALYAFYHQQASALPGMRLTAAPSGRPVDLAGADMPVPDAAVFMAPHPGQGALLERLIDPSVIDESDPMSRDPELDAFDERNGFVSAPQPSRYAPEFVERYRRGQAARVARIDERARRAVAEAQEAKAVSARTGDVRDRQKSLAPHLIPIYRTDADLRSMDPTLDANDRNYGSLFGARPDLTNYGLTGFARLCTPESWLSTWSANTSHAAFLACAPGVTVPTLLIELTGDQACFPADADAMTAAFGSDDIERVAVRGTHFGAAITAGEPTGVSSAAEVLGDWIRRRYA